MDNSATKSSEGGVSPFFKGKSIGVFTMKQECVQLLNPRVQAPNGFFYDLFLEPTFVVKKSLIP